MYIHTILVSKHNSCVQHAESTAKWPITEAVQHTNTNSKNNMEDTYERNTKQTKEYLNTSLGHLMTHLAHRQFFKNALW